MTGKVERVPAWRLRRLNVEQRAAVDRLRWHDPPPAERARLKMLLGWRRTRVETVALARELLAGGMLPMAAADALEVGDRYLRRLLAADRVEAGLGPAETDPANPHRQRAQVALTRESGTDARPARRRPPTAGFASFRDLDRWLDEAAP